MGRWRPISVVSLYGGQYSYISLRLTKLCQIENYKVWEDQERTSSWRVTTDIDSTKACLKGRKRYLLHDVGGDGQRAPGVRSPFPKATVSMAMSLLETRANRRPNYAERTSIGPPARRTANIVEVSSSIARKVRPVCRSERR